MSFQSSAVFSAAGEASFRSFAVFSVAGEVSFRSFDVFPAAATTTFHSKDRNLESALAGMARALSGTLRRQGKEIAETACPDALSGGLGIVETAASFGRPTLTFHPEAALPYGGAAFLQLPSKAPAGRRSRERVVLSRTNPPVPERIHLHFVSL